MTTASRETPDALGWGKSSRSVLIECKSNRADFLRDKKKFFRKHSDYGMGYSRYYMAPAKIIKKEELPAGWGLLEIHRSSVHTIVPSEPFPDTDARKEIQLLISAIRRIGQDPPAGISVRCYSFNSKNRATLGILDNRGGKSHES